MCVCLYVSMYACMYVCMGVCMYVHMSVCVYVSMYACVYMHTLHTVVYIYICILPFFMFAAVTVATTTDYHQHQ
eukprot:NODE_1275_length_1012_cov_417.359294_g887_i0.p4 GENE.NODE_1275_length_1012_cov_417.359294_g887_i0~~NODE_1275_length_1012_cov_417.359294_g887_i0.p4  ORF type:complete len:74 (-),score=17.20 NODE_1275_length_1012_cov_417.359294_g887_i0:615-836(-)